MGKHKSRRSKRVVPVQVYDEGVEDEADPFRSSKQFDDVDVFEYELPEDFEDEEIEEDEAFGSDDEELEEKLNPSAGSKRKREDDGNQPEKRRKLSEDALVGEINQKEEALNVVGRRGGGAGVEAEDVMAALDDSKEFGELRKRLDRLHQKNLPVSTPLAAIKRDRIGRKVAYKETVQSLKVWKPLVEQQGRAEHLHFPLKEQEDAPGLDHTTRTLSSSFKPTTEVEARVAAVLNMSGITEERLLQHQELAMNKLSAAEVKQRQDELQRAKHLMLYQEKKWRLRKKIKSKKYRRILRKARERAELSIEELEVIDPDAARAAKEKREEARIRERFTQKHRSTSRWAQRAKRLKDPHSRKAIQEQIRMHEELTSKMNRESDSSDDSEYSSSDGEEVLRQTSLSSQRGTPITVREEDEADSINTGWERSSSASAGHSSQGNGAPADVRDVTLDVTRPLQMQAHVAGDARGGGRAGGFASDQLGVVREAFVGDEVALEEFAKEVEEEEEEATKDTTKDSRLPGWGSWAGAGTKKGAAENDKKKSLEERRAAKSKRAIRTVIKNPKKQKRSAKYSATKLPFPFSRKEEYEYAMSQPIGPDWNSGAASQKLSLPKVTARVGALIRPMERPKTKDDGDDDDDE